VSALTRWAPWAVVLVLLPALAGTRCPGPATPKDRPLPELKAQRATEADVTEMRQRLAEQDAADAAKWQAQIDEAAAPPADGDPDTQLLALAALARQAKQRGKR